MEEFRDDYEHHWIIEMTDNGIDEADFILKSSLKKMMEIILNVILKNQEKPNYIDLFRQVHLEISNIK